MEVKFSTNKIVVSKADGTKFTEAEWAQHGGAVQQNLANAVFKGLNDVDGIEIPDGGLELTITVEKVTEHSETYAGRA